MTDLLYVNGLDAATGEPLTPPVSPQELAQRVREQFMRGAIEKAAEQERYEAFEDVPDDDPAEAGWGLLVHEEDADAMRDALSGLIARRNGRVFVYRGEPALGWKDKHKAEVRNPDVFPHYVLIAGSPKKVPFELQFSLSVSHAVGRVDFDRAEDYAQYAENVLKRERGELSPPDKRALFFAPWHDEATRHGNISLARPLLEQLPSSVSAEVEFEHLLEDDATKLKLLKALAPDGARRTPGLVFSASHGAALQSAAGGQRELQGSVICQDRKFPLTREKQDGFLTGYDVEKGLTLPGGVLFLFACYGAGTRETSDFARYLPRAEDRARFEAAQSGEDFTARLPKALLALKDQGAVAVVGHVDPGWASSFAGQRLDAFGRALARMLRGKPVGYALAPFHGRYSELSTDLLNSIAKGEDPMGLSSTWVRRNDAQNYLLIGDPAARLILR